MGQEYNRQFVEKLKEKGVQILENNDKIEKNADECRLTGYLVVLEPIQKAVSIDSSQLQNNNKDEENNTAE